MTSVHTTGATVPQAAGTVLVVGAGGSGLATALELARAGVAVRVVDAAAGPCRESRGNGLQARTLELLDLHGVTDDLVARGNPVDTLTVFAGGERLTEVDFRLAPSRFTSLVLPQCHTEEVLRRRLADHGVEVEWGTRLEAIVQDHDRVTATLQHDGGSTEAVVSWLVGADGAGSTVRKLLGFSFDGVSFEERWGLMDAALDWELPGDRIRVFRTVGGRGQLITVPLGGDRYRVQTDDIDRDDRAAPSLAHMQELFDRYSGVPGTLSSPTWTSSFRVHCRQVVAYRDRRVFLAGDAAHIHTPAGGQGLNTGIQDGINLGWKLALVAAGHAGAELLDSYEQERAPVAAAVLRLTEVLARDPGRVSVSAPADRVQVANVVSQCAITYHGGPLAATEDDAGSGLRAGDRLPDVLVDGQRLHERLRTGRVTVVRLGAAELPHVASAAVDLWDVDTTAPDQPLAEALGFRDGLAVIRPDGYLGCSTARADGATVVQDHLADVLRLSDDPHRRRPTSSAPPLAASTR
ncbi:monooxygenase, FAD-binding protein [Modestobacter sp. I12A-02628]|uniref:Monooxygenase, FAD-binding protein n=1 Tax=Goekera deserti TaxID=2497753 RepID=A0A7K3WBN4_9ACTN|nr:FAD-dependent monooxygenase [Goekera deserti]MPQ97421.1 monooxygenase, FAD-binding protein [Goekera deserti]NDI47978.1 monooxygenase, FAD-binding protein [Goekera deserti]NEL53726.1 monooxygenase, FAD-binding protein [Goekera deserti]